MIHFPFVDRKDTFPTNKPTLAEIAHNTFAEANVESFDSVTSDVFLSSSQSVGSFRNIPELSLEANSDSESESGNNADELLNYERMKEGGKQGLDIPVSQSLASIDSFLSESSQNLLGEDYESHDGENGESKASSTTNSRPPSVQLCGDKLELESYVGGSDISESTLELSDVQVKADDTPQLSPRMSLSSEQDLINFEMDVVREASKRGLDAQSIDSHMFTLIDNESFNELNSPSCVSNDGIAEDPEEEQRNNPEVTVTHVRFSSGMECLRHYGFIIYVLFTSCLFVLHLYSFKLFFCL